MNRYVLGFLFDNNNGVWLINKTKPDWQKGKLNGIGGKVELNDYDVPAAMTREFKEETGVTITDWKVFCCITDEDKYEIFCYSSYSDQTPQTTTDEVVGRYDLNNLPDNVLFNSFWLIPMAKHANGRTYLVKEEFEIKNHDDRPVVKEELCKHDIPIDEICDDCAYDMGLRSCEQCDEIAWDGRICHACGAKDI